MHWFPRWIVSWVVPYSQVKAQARPQFIKLSHVCQVMSHEAFVQTHGLLMLMMMFVCQYFFFPASLHFLKVWREDSTEFDVKDRAPTKSWNLNVLGGGGQFRELTWVGCCSGLDSCFSFHSCYATALSNLKASKVQTKAIFKMLS